MTPILALKTGHLVAGYIYISDCVIGCDRDESCQLTVLASLVWGVRIETHAELPNYKIHTHLDAFLGAANRRHD